MRPLLALLVVLIGVTPVWANKKPAQDCKVSFGFAYTDRLDNDYRGIQGKELKEVEKRLTKYGDVCYTADDASADYIFYVHTKPAVYHGVQAGLSLQDIYRVNEIVLAARESADRHQIMKL